MVMRCRRVVFHIASKDRWLASGDDYHEPSLDNEGFIHCSTADQLLIPANERFAGRSDLVVLVVDTALVTAPVVFEDCYRTGMEFPHIYGPIPIAAVTSVVPFPPENDGTFTLPTKISELG